jgi:hypothetical protein
MFDRIGSVMGDNVGCDDALRYSSFFFVKKPISIPGRVQVERTKNHRHSKPAPSACVAKE